MTRREEYTEGIYASERKVFYSFFLFFFFFGTRRPTPFTTRWKMAFVSPCQQISHTRYYTHVRIGKKIIIITIHAYESQTQIISVNDNKFFHEYFPNLPNIKNASWGPGRKKHKKWNAVSSSLAYQYTHDPRYQKKYVEYWAYTSATTLIILFFLQVVQKIRTKQWK